MFKIKKQYEEQEYIKKVLFLVYPETYFIWHDIDRLLKQNYPLEKISYIIKERYNV